MGVDFQAVAAANGAAVHARGSAGRVAADAGTAGERGDAKKDPATSADRVKTRSTSPHHPVSQSCVNKSDRFFSQSRSIWSIKFFYWILRLLLVIFFLRRIRKSWLLGCCRFLSDYRSVERCQRKWVSCKSVDGNELTGFSFRFRRNRRFALTSLAVATHGSGSLDRPSRLLVNPRKN